MRRPLTALTILFIFCGFVYPILWIGAVITGILAMAASPGGTRPDGKPRSGGLLGGLIDKYEISRTMRDCPYCKMKIMKTATKCPYCQEFIEPIKELELTCPNCGLKHPISYRTCTRCGTPLYNEVLKIR